jgi:predicted enzyme related to lactoylglutathione lyase
MELRIVRPITSEVLDAACRFYGEVLGWPLTHHWDAPDRGRIYGYGDVARIELIESNTTEPVTGLYLSVQVDDVDEHVRLLEAAGIAVIDPPTDRPWGHRNAAALDPTGLRVVFFAPLPAA